MNELTIVAFLQNMWVRPHQVARVSRFDPLSEERKRMTAYALFAGCVTGRRLKRALGEDICSRIVWQEASPVVADNPRDYHPPDLQHVRAVLNKYQPQLVLCFTRAGEGLIRTMLDEGTVFVPCQHPAARKPNGDLERARKIIEALIK